MTRFQSGTKLRIKIAYFITDIIIQFVLLCMAASLGILAAKSDFVPNVSYILYGFLILLGLMIYRFLFEEYFTN